MRRVAILVSSLLLVSTVPTLAAEGDAPQTVRLLAPIAEDPAIEQQFIDQIQEFNDAHPDITVEREAMDNDQLRTIIQTRLRSGDIDVFSYDSGPGFGGVLASAGLVAPLDEAYEQYAWPIFDWARSRCTYGGVTYCVPNLIEQIGVFYNKDIFEEHGLTPPATLEDFETLMDQLLAEGVIPLAFGNQPQWPAGHQFSMTLSNLVGQAGLDAKLAGESPWNDPETVRAIDIYFRDFLEAGYFPPDPNAITYDDAVSLFYAGEAAMLPTGTWIVAEIVNNVDFEAGYFPFPSIDGSVVAPPAGVGSGTFISSASEVKDAAAVFLDWLQQDDVVARWKVETFNQIPASPVDTEGLDIPPLFDVIIQDMTSGEREEFGYNIDVLTPAGFNEQMWTGFQEVMGGSLTPQEQADRLEAAYQAAIEAGEVGG